MVYVLELNSAGLRPSGNRVWHPDLVYESYEFLSSDKSLVAPHHSLHKERSNIWVRLVYNIPYLVFQLNKCIICLFEVGSFLFRMLSGNTLNSLSHYNITANCTNLDFKRDSQLLLYALGTRFICKALRATERYSCKTGSHTI